MRQKLHISLALVLGGVLFGCAVRPTDGPYESSNSKALHFKGYREAYVYIAKCESLPADDNTVLKLAAESTMKVVQIENIGTLHIIEAEYYDGVYDRVRGAQANGRYYVLRENNGKFDLAGILEGNAYRWSQTGKSVALQTHWDSGEKNSEDGWISYPWNGRAFGAIAPASLPTFCKPASP